MSVFDHLLGELPALLRGLGRGETNSELLDEWETICGHQLPSSYRAFASEWAGSYFGQPPPCFLIPNQGEFAQVAGWLHIAGPSFTHEQTMAMTPGSNTVEYATSQIRGLMDVETGGLAKRWGAGIVALGDLVVDQSWVGFDMSFEAAEPPVVVYSNAIQWTDTPPTIDFVAPDFMSFLKMLQPTDYEVMDNGAQRNPTQASLAWLEHASDQLGGLTRTEVIQEIRRRTGW